MFLHYSLYILVCLLTEELRLQKNKKLYTAKLQTLSLAFAIYRCAADPTSQGGQSTTYSINQECQYCPHSFFFTIKGSVFCRDNIGFGGRPRVEEKKKVTAARRFSP